MIIQYEVYSDKKEDVALVAKYWAKDEHGKFEHKVASLIPYGDITSTPKLTKYINTISKAWYEPFRCKRCEEHIRVWSRTSPLPRHNQTCDQCWQTLEEERRYLLQKKAEEAQRRIDLITKENKHLRVDYTSVADDAALLLLALRKAVKPKFLWESFELNDCKGLAPTNIDVLLSRLERAGVLIREFSSAHAHLCKYAFSGDSELLLDHNKTAYRLVEDQVFGKSEAIFSMLQQREYRDFALIRELWWDFAVADCIQYLRADCDLHGLGLEEDQLKRLESIFQVALETYSIAQIWSITWRVVRNLAAFSTRSYSNKSKEAQRISTQVQKYVERAKREEMVLNNWNRPKDQPVGTLGVLFYELFGMNEDTPSAEIMERLSVRDAEDERLDLIGEVTETIMRRALAMNLSGEVILSFYESTRHGKSVEEALATLLERYPQLDEPI